MNKQQTKQQTKTQQQTRQRKQMKQHKRQGGNTQPGTTRRGTSFNSF